MDGSEEGGRGDRAEEEAERRGGGEVWRWRGERGGRTVSRRRREREVGEGREVKDRRARSRGSEGEKEGREEGGEEGRRGQAVRQTWKR